MTPRPAARAASERRARGGSLAARFVAHDVAAHDATSVLSPGRIEWDASGRIVSLRRARAHERIAPVALLPGLVDAHVHLQIPALHRPERDFLRWVDRVMAARRDADAADHRLRVRQAAEHLLGEGAMAVGEIDSTGASLAALSGTHLAGRCYRELTGFHLRGRAAAGLVGERWTRAGAGRMAVGLSPHAPYSVSPDLMAAAARRTRHLAIHCAELPEEQQFLHTGSGPFADLLQRLGRLPDGHRPPGCGAVLWLERLGVLGANTQLVHCQELERGDVARIASAKAPVVVCPGTIDYFRRTPPPVPTWLRAGLTVGLGTDSLASNTRLSMRAELARAAAMWPELSPAQLLAMATTAGARAIGTAHGVLRRGRRADFMVVPARSTWTETLTAFVHDELMAESIVLAGERRPAAGER